MFPPLVSIILDLLRLLLAVTVLVGHATQPYFQTQWPDLTSFGYAAVGSFFVLSGLVIRALENSAGAHSIRMFYADRASRLLSVALLAVALTIVCDAISYRAATGFYMSNWGQSINLPLVRIAANLAFFSQPWGWDIELFSNNPFWSLGYESGFYLLWGLMVYAQRSHGNRWLLAIGALIYGPNVLMLMPLWFLGINLFELTSREVRISPLRAWLPAIVAVSIMLLFSAMARRQLFAGKDLFAVFGLHAGRVSFTVMLGGVVTYIVLLPILLGAQRVTAVRISPQMLRVARFLGEATFPLYLMHFPMLVLARSLHIYDPASALQKLAVMLGIVAFAAACVPVASKLKYRLRIAFRRLLGTSLQYDRASAPVRAADDVAHRHPPDSSALITTQVCDISPVNYSTSFRLGSRMVKRLGYGAMQLAGPGVFGPPKDPDAARAVLRESVASGVNHIDTADFYGPHITNQIIRDALHPYAEDLVIVSKLGAVRGSDGSWNPAFSRAELTQAVHDNLRNLELDVLEVVNLRSMYNVHHPAEGSIEAPLTVLAELQHQGLVRHIGLSNVTATQIDEGRRLCEIVCVQNVYNLAHRADDALIDELDRQGIAYVPFFPLGGFTPLQSSVLTDVASGLGATPMQVALAWLLHRAPNILLIPGTSSVAHLRENLASGQLTLSAQTLAQLDTIAS